MQVPAQGQSRLKRAWHHFVESNYLTWFTDWMMKFGGKGAHSVLIITTLYMSAELYPGVSLPPELNLTVFLLQMFMLDIGGLGLATLARQARGHGNTEGATHASRLSKFLIAIMIAGIVTVCAEQAVSGFDFGKDAQNWINVIKIIIEVSLVVARAFCAVLYGVVIHALQDDHRSQKMVIPIPDLEQKLSEMMAQIQAEMQSNLNAFHSGIVTQLEAKFDQLEPLDYDAIASALVPHLPAQESFQLDMAQLASEVAPLVRACDENETLVVAHDGTDCETPNETQQPRITVKLADLPVEQTRNTDKLQLVPRSTRKSSTETSEAATKMRRIVKRNPSIGPTELAKKASVSKSTASRFLKNLTTVA